MMFILESSPEIWGSLVGHQLITNTKAIASR